MIKYLKIKGIESEIRLYAGNIHYVCIENLELYFTIVHSLIDSDNDNIIYSEDYVIKPFEKNSILITDIFNIDINNKKILSALYKYIDKNKFNLGIKEKLDNINNKIINVLEDISLDMNVPMDFNDDLDINKLLSMYNFSFLDDNTISPCERLIKYIKAYLEISYISIVFLIDIMKYFNENDKNEIEKEMSYLGITIIDISLFSKTRNRENLIIIDDDLCEF